MNLYLQTDDRPGSASRMWGERLSRLFQQRGFGITRELSDPWEAALYITHSRGIEAAVDSGRTVGFRVANGYHPDWFAAMRRTMKAEHHAVNADIAHALELANTVIYQSHWAKAELDGLLFNRSQGYSIIYNGTDLRLFHPPATRPSGPPVIGSVGRMRYRYRLETLFEMSRRLQVPHRLLLVGSLDEECSAVLHRYRSDPLIGPRLTHFPFTRPEDLPALYAQMSLLVHPVSGDACPNVVVEALACGLPVVAPRHGGTAELVGETGAIFENEPWVYDDLFVERMAEAVSRILPVLEELSPLARRRAEEMFDIEDMADRYLEALNLPHRTDVQPSLPLERPQTALSKFVGSATVWPRFYAAAALRKAARLRSNLIPRRRGLRPRIAFTLCDFHVKGSDNWLFRLANSLQEDFDFYFLYTDNPNPLPIITTPGRCAYLPGPAQMTRFLQKHNIDLIQVHNERWPVDAALAAGVPHIIERLGDRQSWRRTSKRGLDCLIAPTQMAVQAVMDLAPPDRIHMINDGIDLEAVDAYRPQRLFPVDTTILGYISTFGRDKNLELLIEALARLRPRFPQLRLVLVDGDTSQYGEGPPTEEILRKAELKDRLRFIDPVEDLLPLIQGFDLVVWITNEEDLPNSLLEAMACRKPVISTSLNPITELIHDGENGLLFPAGNLEALCEQLGRLLTDPGLAGRLGEAGRRTVEERFSLRVTAARYAELYRNLLGG